MSRPAATALATLLALCTTGWMTGWMTGCTTGGATPTEPRDAGPSALPDGPAPFCEPGRRACDGTVSRLCDDDGARWLTSRDCALTGAACGDAGSCDDPCGEVERTRSYLGCEHWAVPLANLMDSLEGRFDYRIAVAAPSDASAPPTRVRVERGGATVATATVAPGSVEVIPLPWIAGVSDAHASGAWTSGLARDGAYRVIADRPIVAFQFNPFEYVADDDTLSFTNDASLLLPWQVLASRYLALTFAPLSTTLARSAGSIAVVGTAEGVTTVRITLAGDAALDRRASLGTVTGGETLVVTLERGEVLQLATGVPPRCREGRPGFITREACDEEGRCTSYDACEERALDLTGSRIESDRPIAVFGAHVCANAPYDRTACDHLEEQLLPTRALGRSAVLAPLVEPGHADRGNLVRIIAVSDATVRIVDATGEQSVTLAASEHVDRVVTAATRVEGSAPIAVYQRMLGQDATSPPATRGDPSLSLVPPVEQWRRDYLFVAPSSYREETRGQSFVRIVRPVGVAVTLDGAPLPARLGERLGEHETDILPIEGGAHVLEGDEPFSATVFGLGIYTSYAFPAGLDLAVVSPE